MGCKDEQEGRRLICARLPTTVLIILLFALLRLVFPTTQENFLTAT
jgi:hypothetical protein